MARRFFKRFLPNREKLKKDRWFKGRLAWLLHQPNFWHLNRDSVARGIGAGGFWAFIPIPGQTVLATITAIKMRGNIGLAIAATWISNPLTMAPAAYIAYRLGLFAMLRGPKENVVSDMTAAWQKSWSEFFAWCGSNMDVIIPYAIGSVILSAIMGVICYFASMALWRLLVVIKLRRRQVRLKRILANGPRSFPVGGVSAGLLKNR